MPKKAEKKRKNSTLSESSLYIKGLKEKGFRKRTFIIHNDDYAIVHDLTTGLRKNRLHDEGEPSEDVQIEIEK